MVKILQQRFNELDAQRVAVEATKQTKHNDYIGSYQDIAEDLLVNWCVKARNLLVKACGAESQHFIQFEKCEALQTYVDNYERLKRLGAVFQAAKEDFEGGYLNSLKSFVQAEVFDNELEQAAELLSAGYTSAGAVIAGVVLETTLRDLCDQHSIVHGKLDKMNADLAKAGVYNKLVQKQITALADLRNSAAHGKVQEFNKDDVENMIQQVGRLVSEMLSNF